MDQYFRKDPTFSPVRVCVANFTLPNVPFPNDLPKEI